MRATKPQIRYAELDGDTVFFAGEGFLIFEEAFVFGWARDDKAAMEGDALMLYVIGPDGEMYWQGGGHVASGFVHIGPAD